MILNDSRKWAELVKCWQSPVSVCLIWGCHTGQDRQRTQKTKTFTDIRTERQEGVNTIRNNFKNLHV